MAVTIPFQCGTFTIAVGPYSAHNEIDEETCHFSPENVPAELHHGFWSGFRHQEGRD